MIEAKIPQEVVKNLDRWELRELAEKFKQRWGICRHGEYSGEERFWVDHATREFMEKVARASWYVGSSYEDNSIYELEPEATSMTEFLRRAGVEDVTVVESNNIDLYRLIDDDRAYLDLYDPCWEISVVVGIREKLLKLSEKEVFRRSELYELFEEEILQRAGFFFTLPVLKEVF